MTRKYEILVSRLWKEQLFGTCRNRTNSCQRLQSVVQNGVGKPSSQRRAEPTASFSLARLDAGFTLAQQVAACLFKATVIAHLADLPGYQALY